MSPVVAEGIAPEEFNFLAVADCRSFDIFGPRIAQEAQSNGGDVALVFIAFEEDFVVALADSGFFVLKADVVVLGIDEGGDGLGGFGEFGGGKFFIGNRLEERQDLAGEDRGGGMGDGGPADTGNIGGVFSDLFEESERLLFFEPAPVTALTPV